jgi:glycine/D-amino acid oxidase-like deaminating enzyme
VPLRGELAGRDGHLQPGRLREARAVPRADDIGFRQTGYVVGVGAPNVDALRKSLAAQRAVGVQTEEIDATRSPAWPTADLSPFAAFGWEARGGYGDAYQTAQAFAVSARAAGVRIRQGANVTDLLFDGDRVTGIRRPTAPRCPPDRRGGHRCVDAAVPDALRHRRADQEVREQIVHIAPGMDIGPVPVFSVLVSLQYVRPELGGESCSATAIWRTVSRRPGRLPEPGTDAFVDLTVEKVGTRFPGLTDAAITGSYAGCYDVTPDWNR